MKIPFLGKKKPKLLSPLEGYNRWAAHYQHESNPIKNFSDSLIENLLPPLIGKHVLDVGCGTGYFCSIAERNQAESIVGIDLSPVMIEQAKLNCPQTDFRCQDIQHLKIDNGTFDVIICALVLAHIENINTTLSTLVNGLKENGVIIISDFHPSLTLKGSKRTFTNPLNKETFEIQHYYHSTELYLELFKEHNVSIHEVKEPLWNNEPVIFVISGTKGLPS